MSSIKVNHFESFTVDIIEFSPSISNTFDKKEKQKYKGEIKANYSLV